MVSGDFIRSMLQYRTARQLSVDVWQIGLFYRTMQLAIFIWVLIDLIANHAYAFKEVPRGTINAWADTTTATFSKVLEGLTSKDLEYCSSDDHDYVYRYVRPAALCHTPAASAHKRLPLTLCVRLAVAMVAVRTSST
jgi:hypothetical protein